MAFDEVPLASGVPMGARAMASAMSLGAAFDIPHGHTSCIMLPAVMRWNKGCQSRPASDVLAAAMGHLETTPEICWIPSSATWVCRAASPR